MYQPNYIIVWLWILLLYVLLFQRGELFFLGVRSKDPNKSKDISCSSIFVCVYIFIFYKMFILQCVSQIKYMYFNPTIPFLRNYIADVLIIMYNDT